MVGRHANYNIGTRAAQRWVEHMEAVLEEHPLLAQDKEASDALRLYFRYTAHYIVAASAFMRPDQVCTAILVRLAQPLLVLFSHSNTLTLLGFIVVCKTFLQLSGGTSIDAGRIW